MNSLLTKRIKQQPIPEDVLQQLKEIAARTEHPYVFRETHFVTAEEMDRLLLMIELGHRV